MLFLTSWNLCNNVWCYSYVPNIWRAESCLTVYQNILLQWLFMGRIFWDDYLDFILNIEIKESNRYWQQCPVNLKKHGLQWMSWKSFIRYSNGKLVIGILISEWVQTWEIGWNLKTFRKLLHFTCYYREGIKIPIWLGFHYEFVKNPDIF